MVNEHLMKELPRCVSDMVDHGYALSDLDKVNGELECDMIIVSEGSYELEWRVIDNDSDTLRIYIGLIVPVDGRMIDKLVDEDGVDRDTARNVVTSLLSKFDELRCVIETIDGELSLVRESDHTKMEFFDITISRDVTVNTLIHLSQAVVDYDKYSMDELDKVGAKYI